VAIAAFVFSCIAIVGSVFGLVRGEMDSRAGRRGAAVVGLVALVDRLVQGSWSARSAGRLSVTDVMAYADAWADLRDAIETRGLDGEVRSALLAVDTAWTLVQAHAHPDTIMREPSSSTWDPEAERQRQLEAATACIDAGRVARLILRRREQTAAT
jgi:hypothetical protein